MTRQLLFNRLIQIILLFYCTTTNCDSSYSKFIFPSEYFSESSVMKDMRVINGWKTVDFVFPSISSRRAFIRSGRFIPGNSLILDSDYWQDGIEDVIFVTLPRFRKGIPATLATVSPQTSFDGSYKLQPYPDWSWQRESNCEGIVSAFRTKVDECGRLWIIDSGMTNILGTAQKMCPPKLMVFDLHTNKLVMKYVFPEEVLGSSSLLVTVAVEIRAGNCRDTFAYVADVTEFGLIVFDGRSRQSWRVNSNYFYPYPLHGAFNIAGKEFDLMDGIIGLAVSPEDNYGDRTLYFHSLASLRESKVSTSLLKNESNFLYGENKVSKKFLTTDEVRPSQSAAQDMSNNQVLFFGLLSSNAIACWNSRTPYLPFNIVTLAQNNRTLQFPSGVKVVKKNGFEELLVTSSKFQNYMLERMDQNEVNFRILSASVDDLVKNTICEFGSQHLFPESYQSVEINAWK